MIFSIFRQENNTQSREVHVHVDTNLFRALLENRKRNTAFYEDLDFAKIEVDGELKALKDILKEDMGKTVKIFADNEVVREFLRKRIDQLKVIGTDMKSKSGKPILEMKAGADKQIFWGIDHEEMMAELAEVFTIAAIEEIMKKFQDLGPEAQIYFIPRFLIELCS